MMPPGSPFEPVVQKPAEDKGRPSTLSSLSFTTNLLLADNILIDGVGCRQAKDKSSDCNHDNSKDD